MKFQRFTKHNILINLLLTTIYLAWCYFFIGLRIDHFFIIAVCLITFYGNNYTRKFVIAFSVFLVYWILYDSLRVFPNHLCNPVHIEQPYNLEKWLFGFNYQGIRVTPNEFFAATHKPLFDIISGLFYLNWVPLPLGFAFYLFATRKKELFYKFGLVFLLTNIIGFIGYYVYPAAPPWYFAEFGNQFVNGPLDSRAGFIYFDNLIGIDFFKNVYSKNSNIFAAIPSLHSAYPLIVLFYASKLKKTWLTIAIAIITFGIWFSAIYSGHHYIIDVLLGFICAVIGIIIFRYLIRIPKIQKLLQKYADIYTL